MNETPSVHVQLVGNAIDRWLREDDDQWSPRQLVRWLQGYELPSSRGEIEAYEWLIWGLGFIGERETHESKFCARLADFMILVVNDCDPVRLLENVHCKILINERHRFRPTLIGGTWKRRTP